MTKATIIVEGWIQSIGYRAFVKQAASQLELKGLVRNLPNGKVEIFCEGDLAKINLLTEKIDFKGKRGDPLSAYVENLSIHLESEQGYLGPWKAYKEFEIDYGIDIPSSADRLIIENLESGKIYVATSNLKFDQLTNQFSLFREETNGNFGRMEGKYGSISEEMKKMRTILERLAEAYIEKQK